MVVDYQGPVADHREKPEQTNKIRVGHNPDNTKSVSSTKNKQINSNTTFSQQSRKRHYELPPLILEGVNLSRVALNKFLIRKIPDLKCNNIIYNDKNRNFTIYPSTIASFNALLTRLPIDELSDNAKIYIPRSIQRIQKIDTEAFVKRVDREFSINDIQQALIQSGYKVNQVERLTNKNKTEPSTTIKITFDDVKNRDTFTRLGLQIEHVHFPAEKAKQKNVPQQCHSCYRFGHISKYCKQSHPNCSHCAGPHRYEICHQKQQQPKCCNCHGPHQATSTDCPRYKEQQKHLQSTIDRYSSSSTALHTPTSVPNQHDLEEYPSISSSSFSSINSQSLNSIIEACTAATTAAIERITEQLVVIFTEKLNELTRRTLSTLQLPIDATIDSTPSETNSNLNNKNEEKANRDLLDNPSNPDHGLIIGGTSDTCETNPPNPNQLQRNVISNANGTKRSSNINSPTTHQPKRTIASTQSTNSRTKSNNNTLVI